MRNKIYLFLLICQLALVLEMCHGSDWFEQPSAAPAVPSKKTVEQRAVKLHMQYLRPHHRHMRLTTYPMPQWQPRPMVCQPMGISGSSQQTSAQLPCVRMTVRT